MWQGWWWRRGYVLAAVMAMEGKSRVKTVKVVVEHGKQQKCVGSFEKKIIEISRLSPPPPPSTTIQLFPYTITTTTTFLLFSLFCHHHHTRQCIFIVPTTTTTIIFLLFVSTATVAKTITFLFFSLHHYYHHIAIVFPSPSHFYSLLLTVTATTTFLFFHGPFYNVTHTSSVVDITITPDVVKLSVKTTEKWCWRQWRKITKFWKSGRELGYFTVTLINIKILPAKKNK